jgi:putative flippase GtrA
MMLKQTIPNLKRLIKSGTLIQAAKYVVVGGFCTILDFSLLFFITHFFGINYLISSIISFMSGTILNYFLCTLWIFKIRVVQRRVHEFIYYLLITGIGLVFNTSLIWIFTEFVGLYYLLSKIVATFVTYFWNFYARKYFLHSIR